jgi:hypothetical protein
MGWLIAIGCFAVWIFIAWIPDYLSEKRRAETRRLAEERQQEFHYHVANILGEYPELDKNISDVSAVLTKFIDVVRSEKIDLKPKPKAEEEIITLPRDGDMIGKCPMCKANNLVLRGGSRSGYIKCRLYPNCQYMKPYSDLSKFYQRRKEKLLIKDLEKAYS